MRAAGLTRKRDRVRNARMVPHDQRRHHLDAGQVGISLVCGLGPGVPYHCRSRWWIRISPSQQLDLMLRNDYLHPNGQMPAYEWNFSDVNPPVHASATHAVYLQDQEQQSDGKGDIEFLAYAFSKLLMNFTWWVNRKDRVGKNVFEGGFLGLDNIGVFDR